ncbi:MAG: hypothetical protein U9P72_06905 [Campylobacterota bacterium]|nr:hypothetical protein [Campylobacterota bacterium]
MKKSLKKIILATLLTLTPLLAEECNGEYENLSLIGLETSFNTLEVANDATPVVVDKYNFSSAAIKLGAEMEYYRLFLSARYYPISDFDYAYTLGAELQYLINFSESMNFFIGINTGVAEMKFLDSKNVSRTISDQYFGGDIGLNYYINRSFDWEVGVRVMGLNAENEIDNITYTFDNIISAYTSIIFKYQISD